MEIAAGYRVINRRLEPVEADNVFVASDMVVVWTSLLGVRAGFIEHVWLHDGVEVARHYLPVGSDRRWRTWSRHRVDPGEYEVRVFGPDGAFLTKTTFTVAAEGEDEGCWILPTRLSPGSATVPFFFPADSAWPPGAKRQLTDQQLSDSFLAAAFAPNPRFFHYHRSWERRDHEAES
ncbi:MAG TPA: DUF2914 domain-containing protein [Polyangia bacterium]|nr:DUF2914 domain-containing protein [Polyangia bacterium]